MSGWKANDSDEMYVVIEQQQMLYKQQYANQYIRERLALQYIYMNKLLKSV